MLSPHASLFTTPELSFGDAGECEQERGIPDDRESEVITFGDSLSPQKIRSKD